MLAFRIITLVGNLLVLLFLLVGFLVTSVEADRRNEEEMLGLIVASCIIFPFLLLNILYVSVEIYRGLKQAPPVYTPTYPENMDYWSPRRQRNPRPGEDSLS